MSSFYEIYHKSFIKTKSQNKIISERNFTYVNFFRFVLPAIRRESPTKILDVGSGSGTIGLYLSSLGFKVIGLDVSKHAVDRANASAQRLDIQSISKYINIDFVRFSSNEKFDVIICFEVIEHLENDNFAIQKLKEKLAPGGLLALSTPLKSAPLSKIGLTRKFDRNVGHLRRYSESEIKMKIENVGFTIIKIVKTEGIIRNSLYVFPRLGFIIKFIRSYMTDIVTFFDDLSGKLFGYSDIIILARKK